MASRARAPALPRIARRVAGRARSFRKAFTRRSLASAVLVPPLVLYFAALAAVTALSAVFHGGFGWELLRAATVAAVAIPVTYAVGTILRTVGPAWFGRTTVLPLAGVVVVLLEAAVPGSADSVALLGAVAVVSVAVPILARRWRNRWEKFPDVAATLVLATPDGARETIERLEAVPGLRIVSVLIPEASARITCEDLGRPVFSRVNPLLNPERWAIVSSRRRDSRVDSLVAHLVARGFDVASESSVLRAAEGCVDSEQADPLNLLLSHPRRGFLDVALRFRDVFLALVALVALAPLFLAIGLAIRLDSRGPVFFRQRRLGARGRPFKVIKFRTMRRDAEAATGPVWATENDPRVTRVGRFLRRTRLDELPQLVNVILGEMALVGPRPERPHFFRRLRHHLPIFELRTAVRPGITGWAQIRAPYAAAKEEARVKLDHDLFYLCRRSFWFDLAILFDTVSVSLCGKGAR
jgi:exopolysaccharide biosynthesis polyprenyl glycosylphosphotransferase